MTLARTLGLVAGVHFGARTLRVALADTAHKIVAEQRMPLAPDHRADIGLDRVALLLGEMFDQVGADPSELLGVGVGVAAPVDIRTGEVSTRGLLRGWDGVSVTEMLGQQIAAPVHVDNDANLGALAEARRGAARGYEHVVYIRISHGVGAGLLLDGKIFHGRSGTAGEIGHTTIDDTGPVCRCGNRGCLEMYVGAPVILGMLEGSHGHLSMANVLQRAREGDLGCRRVLEDACSHLGISVANVCNLVDPEVVVVGGQVAEAGDVVLDPLRAVLSRRAIPSNAGPVPVVSGQLGASAELHGALLLALEHVDVTARGAAS